MAAVLEEEYSYKPTVIKGTVNEDGVRVWILDDDNTNVVDQTTVSGTIPLQWLQNQVRTDTGTGFVQETETPHKVRLLKYGLVIREIVTTIADAGAPDLFVADNPYTVLTKVAAQALTGINVNHTTSTIEITQSRTLSEIYDFVQADSVDNPQADEEADILQTADGNGFTSQYGFNISGGAVLDLQGKTVTLAGGAAEEIDLNNGQITNGTLIGILRLFTAENLSDLRVTGTFGNIQVNIGANASLLWTNVICSTGDGAIGVQNGSAANTLDITNAGGDLTAVDPGTGVGQTNIIENPIVLTIKGWISGAVVVIYDDDSADPQELGTELQRNNNITVDETYQYFAPKVGDDIVITHYASGYKQIQDTITLGAASADYTLRPILETN